MTVLVTGGMGYIGSHTCVELLEQGMDVVVVDNLVNSSAEAGKRVEQITGRPLKFYQMDVRDRAGLDRIFTEQKIDCVIHFAGLKAVGESVQMPLEYYDNNLGSTITLCEAMRDHGVRQIIFSSSATVYSGDNEMPLYETSRTGNCIIVSIPNVFAYSTSSTAVIPQSTVIINLFPCLAISSIAVLFNPYPSFNLFGIYTFTCIPLSSRKLFNTVTLVIPSTS